MSSKSKEIREFILNVRNKEYGYIGREQSDTDKIVFDVLSKLNNDIQAEFESHTSSLKMTYEEHLERQKAYDKLRHGGA